MNDNNNTKVREEMKPYLPLARCCEPCLKTVKSGKILRAIFVLSNILFWFAGCAVLSVSIWLRFVDVAATKYFSTFAAFDITLYVILVGSILILVISFVGTCAANTKSQPLIAFYSVAVVVLVVAEIIALIIYGQQQGNIKTDFELWFKNHFVNYNSNETIHHEIVDHMQAKMGCCGLTGVKNFLVSSKHIPASCTKPSEFKKQDILRPQVYSEGCLTKIDEFLDWLLRGWPIPLSMTFLLLIELTGIISSILFLLHMFVRKFYSYDDDDDESSGLISKSKNTNSSLPIAHDNLKTSHPLTEELPKPKVFRIPKAPEDRTFGFSILFDHIRMGHMTHEIEKGSNAGYAQLTSNSHIIEMNGMMVQGISSEEVNMKLESADNEMRILVIEESASIIYKSNKVAVNLRNVQGVTSVDVEYKPRLCEFEKSSHGFGFHLLYLEDRKGEFIEDLAANGPAEKAGLRIGDRIVEVNGVNIEREKSKEVVSRIRASGNMIRMLVLDPKADGYYRKKAVTVTASLATKYFANQVQAASQSQKRKRKNHRDIKPRYCRLIKGSREDFGLYVVIDNGRIGQVIRWVDCGGPADRAGLHIGDRIIEVNGENVEYESHQRLIDAISTSKKASHFIVVDEEYDKTFKRNKPRLCRIFKERGLFGFAVNYVEKKDGHYVDEIDANGPADRAGLKIGDRVIQINSVNVCHDDNEIILSRLRACESEVVLLVIDSRSDKHYRNIKKFKQTGMDDIDYDTISIPEEPLFLPDVEEDTESQYSEQMTISIADSISMAETKSFVSVATGNTTKSSNESIVTEDSDAQGPRVCTLVKMEHEDHGFFLAVDRDRNGQVIQRIEPGSPADLAGLRNGDRILSINNNKVQGFSHDNVVQIIKASGNKIVFVVLDARSDDLSSKRRPYLFRIMKGESGYGFYMWYDDDGHYVEDITINSPADKAGLRSGDRIIEINSVNIENESHEDVFYRVKACTNTVNLLAVDSKTFAYYKRNNIPVSAYKAETGFSGYHKPASKKSDKSKAKPVTIRQDVKIVKSDNESFGFHLAYSESFMDDDSSGDHVIHWVEKGGPADIAGVRNGDKIMAINGKDVSDVDHEDVYARIFDSNKNLLILTTEFEDSQDVSAPHEVEIIKEDESLGFYLWFDGNGHYIEDVTFGSAADKAGLKIGDRLIEVNGVDVEDEPHLNVFNLVKESGEKVSLMVISIESDKQQGSALPSTINLTKKDGSFGFSIVEDDKGIHFDIIAPDGAADLMGISVGDRLLEVNGESVKGLTYSNVVNIMKTATADIQLTVMSSAKDISGSIGRIAGKNILNGKSGKDGKRPVNVFKQLMEQDKIDYVVEKRKYQEAQGTDLRKKQRGESDTEDESKRGKKKKKHIKKAAKLRYAKGDDNVAFVNEVDGEDEDFVMSLDKDYEESSKDQEGAYLDDKVKRAGILSAKRRKPQNRKVPTAKRSGAKHEKRQHSLHEIESKLGSSKSATTRRYKRSQGSDQNGPKSIRTGGFHLVSNKNAIGQQWSFEQTDSRRPGEVTTVAMDDAKPVERELAAIVEEVDDEKYEVEVVMPAEESLNTSAVNEELDDEKYEDEVVMPAEESLNTSEINNKMEEELNESVNKPIEDAPDDADATHSPMENNAAMENNYTDVKCNSNEEHVETVDLSSQDEDKQKDDQSAIDDQIETAEESVESTEPSVSLSKEVEIAEPGNHDNFEVACDEIMI